MAQACLSHGAVICSDEIHCDLVYSGHRHIPIAALDAEIAHNTITLMSTSKTFNVAGLKFSFAIVQSETLKRRYLQAGYGLVGWANMMGMAAAQAAFQHGNEWLQQLLVYLEANRDFLVGYVRAEMPGIQAAAPEGTYLAWLDCRQAGIDGDPCEFFLKQGRVALGSGGEFGRGGEGHVRLNFGCPRSMVAESLQRMKNALQFV
jgi:cystathionine beta-lyase